jgi:hypothetical protein
MMPSTGGNAGGADRAPDGVDEILCAALRGEDVEISGAEVEASRRHQIHLVLAEERMSLVRQDSDRAALAGSLRTAAMVDLLRERELRNVLGCLATAGVNALLLKGAGLAYTVYQSAHLRPRGDVDLLIERADLEAADRELTDRGWLRAVEHDDPRITTQWHYAFPQKSSTADHLDLHWKIAVPPLFADAIAFEELASRAVAITALGADARTLSLPDALFLACLHRVAHHQDASNLLWLWDIHLLVSRLTQAERALFVSLAATRAMRGVCVRGLELTWQRFATPFAPDLIAALRPPPGMAEEPSAIFLRSGMRQVDSLRHDLRAVDGWRARVAMVSAHLFPNRPYVRSLYPGWPEAALPLAYVDRIVRGAPKWFRGPSE